MPTRKNCTKEIHREIDYGPDKIRLILQFPSKQFPPASALPPQKDALRQEIKAILSRELSGKALL